MITKAEAQLFGQKFYKVRTYHGLGRDQLHLSHATIFDIEHGNAFKYGPITLQTAICNLGFDSKEDLADFADIIPKGYIKNAAFANDAYAMKIGHAVNFIRLGLDLLPMDFELESRTIQEIEAGRIYRYSPEAVEILLETLKQPSIENLLATAEKIKSQLQAVSCKKEQKYFTNSPTTTFKPQP